MKNYPPTFILLFLASIVWTSASTDKPLCCGSETVLLKLNDEWIYECGKGQKPMLECDSKDIIGVNYGQRDYFLQTDDDGTKMYLDELKIVHSPYYCFGNRTRTYYSDTIELILSCRRDVISRNRPVIRDMLLTFVALLFMVSGIFLAITAAIYFFIPQTQDIEGKCTFHLIFNQSLTYLLGAYWCLRLDTMEMTILEEFCISHWYLFVFTLLGFFVWSTVLAYHVRRRFTQNFRIDESKLMHKYLIIGYGIPALLVLIGNVHIYGYHRVGKNSFEVSCNDHRFAMFFFYTALPILITQLTCAFFFVSLQRQLWNAQPSDSPVHSTSTMKKFKFRFLLNAKLFVLTGLPCLSILVCIVLLLMTSAARPIVYLFYSIFYFISCEGIVIFYMLVLSRKRILKGVAGLFGVTLSGWEPCPESEESIAYSNENGNQLLNRELHI